MTHRLVLAVAGAALLGACGRTQSPPVATLAAAPGVVLAVDPPAAPPGARVVVTTIGGDETFVKGALASLRRNDVTVAWLVDDRYGGPSLARPVGTAAAPSIAFRLTEPQAFALPTRLDPGAYRLCTPVGPPGVARTEACGELTVTG